MNDKPLDILIQNACAFFFPEGKMLSAASYGNGHINDTFLVSLENKREISRYILQRINQHVFNDPLALMENISGVTSYLSRKLKSLNRDAARETLTLIEPAPGQNLYTDQEGGCWRCFPFLENTLCLEQAESEADLQESGRAFGDFQYLLSEYPAHTLHQSIPYFHHTPRRYQALCTAAETDAFGRASQVVSLLQFAALRQEKLSLALHLLEDGALPLRVTHNDTKLNNVLFDRFTRKAVCVIDLDTIMPGLSLYDFGDAIRFGASAAPEDEPDLSRVALSLSLFDAYTKGYLEGLQGSLTDKELDLLPYGAWLMTMECGIRFLTDYLEGDIYFKTAFPDHNLTRAKAQFALAQDMEKKEQEMKKIVGNHR